MAVCDHKSVGVLVWKDGKLLLIERRKPPYGFAPPAGHVDDHGSFENAAKDELKEEVGLDAVKLELLAEGRKNNRCRREGGDWHYWRIFNAKAQGEVKASEEETKKFGWYSEEQLKDLAGKTEIFLKGEVSDSEWESSPGLEPVWKDWLSELKII